MILAAGSLIFLLVPAWRHDERLIALGLWALGLLTPTIPYRIVIPVRAGSLLEAVQ